MTSHEKNYSRKTIHVLDIIKMLKIVLFKLNVDILMF